LVIYTLNITYANYGRGLVKAFVLSIHVFLFSLIFNSSQIYASNSSVWSGGLGVVRVDSNFNGVDNELLALPLIAYSNERLSIAGFSLEYKLMQSSFISTTLLLEPGDFYLDASKSKDVSVSQLKDRNLSIYLGPQISMNTWIGSFSAKLMQDVSLNSKGYKISANYNYSIEINDKFSVVPELGVTYNSDKISDYYFGLNSGEISGFNPYSLSETINTSVGVKAVYSLTERISFVAYAKKNFMDGKIEKSPITDSDSTAFAMLSVFYRF